MTDSDLLSIGELASASGVAAATLRAWESRYDFPVAVRLPSGHRRYRRSDVDAVREVARRRDGGLRLGAAIAELAQAARPASGSVFATLRREHPHLQIERLHKSTLTALSWAIEDEFGAKADRARLFGAFQTQAFYAPSRRRWAELGRVAASAVALADFGDEGPPEGGPVTHVDLPADSPMRREWAVVCDSRDLPVVLTAWELPGQERVPDRERVFEALWSIEPAAVRHAARVCAEVTQQVAPEVGASLLYALADDPVPSVPDLSAVNAMFTRVLSYVDRYQESR